jgi:hypothetical protein
MSQRLIPTGRTIWIVDAHRDDGKRFVVHGDEKVTAFMELGSAVHASTGDLLFSRCKAKSYTSFRRRIMSFASTKWRVMG